MNKNGERVSDLSEVSNASTQQRRLAVHEGVETLAFRENFDEIVDF